MDGPDPPGLGAGGGGEGPAADRALANAPSMSGQHRDVADRSMVPMQADVGIDAEAPGCACFGCDRYLRDIERLKRLLDCRDNYHQKELEAKQAAVEGMNTAQQDVKDLIDEHTAQHRQLLPPPVSTAGRRGQRSLTGPASLVEDPSAMSFLPSALRGSFAEHVKKQAGQERLRALSSDQAVEVAALMMQTAVKVLGTGGSFKDMNELKTAFSGPQGRSLAEDITSVWRLCEDFASGPPVRSGRRPPQAPPREQEPTAPGQATVPSTAGRTTRSSSTTQEEVEGGAPVRPTTSTGPGASTRGQERQAGSAGITSTPTSGRSTRATESEEEDEEEDDEDEEEEEASTVGRNQVYDEATEEGTPEGTAEVEAPRPAVKKRKRGGQEEQESETEREARERESKRLEKAPLRRVELVPQAKQSLSRKPLQQDVEKLLAEYKGRVPELVFSEDMRDVVNQLLRTGAKGETLAVKSVYDATARLSRFIAQVFGEASEPVRALEDTADAREFLLKNGACVCRMIRMQTVKLVKAPLGKLLAGTGLAFSPDMKRVIDTEDLEEEEREAAAQAEKQPTKLKKAMEKRPNMSGSAEMHAMIEGGIPGYVEKKGGRGRGRGKKASKAAEEAGEEEEEERRDEATAEEEGRAEEETAQREDEAGRTSRAEADQEAEAELEREEEKEEEGRGDGAAKEGEKRAGPTTRRSPTQDMAPGPGRRGGAVKKVTRKSRKGPVSDRFLPSSFPGSMVEFVLWQEKLDHKRCKLVKAWHDLYIDFKSKNAPLVQRAPPKCGKHFHSLSYVQEVRAMLQEVAGLDEVPTTIEELRTVVATHTKALVERSDNFFKTRAAKSRAIANSVWAWWYLYEFLWPEKPVPGKNKPPYSAVGGAGGRGSKNKHAARDEGEEEGAGEAEREDGMRRSKRKSPTPQSTRDEFDFQDDEDSDLSTEPTVLKTGRVAGGFAKARQARAVKKVERVEDSDEDEDSEEEEEEDSEEDEEEEEEEEGDEELAVATLDTKTLISKVFGSARVNGLGDLKVKAYRGARVDPLVIDILPYVKDFLECYRTPQLAPISIESYICKIRRIIRVVIEAGMGSTVEKSLLKMRIGNLRAAAKDHQNAILEVTGAKGYHIAVLFEFADWLKENDPATAPKNTKVTKRGRGRTKQAAPPSIKPLAKPVSRKRKGRHAAEDEEDMEVEEAVSRATEKTSRRPSKRTAESQSAAQEAAAAQEVPEDGRGEEERVAAGQRHAGHVEDGHSREEDLMSMNLDQPDEEDDGTPALELTDSMADAPAAPTPVPPPPLVPPAPTVMIISTNAAAMPHLPSSALLGPRLEDATAAAQSFFDHSMYPHVQEEMAPSGADYHVPTALTQAEAQDEASEGTAAPELPPSQPPAGVGPMALNGPGPRGWLTHWK